MLSVDFAGGLSGKGELTLRAPLSGTFLQRKDVVNHCLEFGVSSVRAEQQAGTHPRRWGSGGDPPQEVGVRLGPTPGSGDQAGKDRLCTQHGLSADQPTDSAATRAILTVL